MNDLRRIAIVNRGEPALRLIHAVRELEAADPVGRVTIALHTDDERAAMFVREADEAVRLEVRPDGAGNPYLDYVELERALQASRADAVWVGWGFVAEHAEFAELCARHGITFIGPSAEVMRKLGDKIASKLLAEQAGVPVAAWSGGPVDTLAQARQHAEVIGFPLVLKATAGGGGRGIRIVGDAAELDIAFDRAREEARRAFGDPTVFMERLVSAARHIEVQVIADQHGGVWAVGVRDCSVQRRNQKVLEESASPVLDDGQVAHLKEAAASLVRAAGYHNAGTVEFLYEPAARRFAFLEVNTRLQVEHPVTEAVTGLDLVKLQIAVAGGARLEGEPPPERGHAVEVRLNAEDTDRGFAPAPGVIDALALPSGPGIRVDTGVAEGDVIPATYDSMIAKLIAWGSDRTEALSRLARAVAQTTVLITGGTTNRAFLHDLLLDPAVRDGTVDTAWLDRRGEDEGYRAPRRPEVALVAAAIEAADRAAGIERSRFFAAAARGRPETTSDVGRTIDLRYAGVGYRFVVCRTGAGRSSVTVGDRVIIADVEPLRRFERRITVGARRYRVRSSAQGADRLIEVDGVPHRISQDDAGLIRTGGPGLLVALTVAEGDEVEAGATVAVVESMKMETLLTAPFAGRIAEVTADRNTQLDAGSPVVRIEPTGEAAAHDDGDTVDFTALAASATAGPDPVEALDGMRRLVLGYDIADDLVPTLVTAFDEAVAGASLSDPAVFDGLTDVLRIVADLSSLSRNRRIGDAEDAAESRAAREYFYAFLRSFDVEAEGLPSSFRDKLTRALAHYGVSTLERSDDLDEALYRIHRGQQRASAQLPVILHLLDRLMADPIDPEDPRSEALRDLLDHLVRATQVRHPAVGDLARRARYRCFDLPRIRRQRAEEDRAIRHDLVRLVEDPAHADREALIAALVDARQPLLPLLEDPEVGVGALHPLLEVLTRRYYRMREIGEVRAERRDGFDAVVAEVRDERGAGRVVATAVAQPDLAAGLAVADALGAAPAQASDWAGSVADIYVTWTDPPADADTLAATLADALDTLPEDPQLRRVTFTVTAGRDTVLEHFTFRRVDGAFVERAYLRGIHPLIAGRLHLWRFQAFELTRLPSDRQHYVFHGVARDNPNDVRLFALAEVRDLTPTYDASGALIGLPEIERVFAACLADLRQARARYGPREQPDWNRVVLYVWPTVDVPLAQIEPLVRGLAPLTDGVGLEQVLVHVHLADAEGGGARDAVLRMDRPVGRGLTVRVTDPPRAPLAPLDAYTEKVLRARRRGTVYPYELIAPLTRAPARFGGDAGAGSFVELDLDEDGRTLVAVERPYGQNEAGIVVGEVRTPTATHPEGLLRVAVLSDPTRGLGSLAEAECRRIAAAIEHARALDVPVEWFAVSSGARIAMDSGTENMDWVGLVLRRIIEFTQDGGEINVVVTGINVGAQPYWNAEATMLMHTRGILVMTPDSAMVLTGKQALDYSGGVSAEDNFGIGGYDRVMGPNGQAQYWAADVAGAVDVLFAHYAHSYVAPGERFPRRAVTTDPADRDVRSALHAAPDSDFGTLGEIFSEASNPGRKKPFAIRSVLNAVIDADHPPLERWADMADADTAVVYDAHLGGYPVALLGFESRPLPRHGFVPSDGPDLWTAGTLFPRSSKKTARAVNAASGNRPLVVVANLSGFDGSPESLRELQLEYGAEIGRAVVNFDGPIVFCVISRYHGGAFVVFSRTLNDDLEVAALEGAHASVIGGQPAAAVVFAGEVRARTERDARVVEAFERRQRASAGETARRQTELDKVRAQVRAEKIGEVAAEFDAVHSVERAREVGSVERIIPPATLRPYLIDAVARGIARHEG